MWLQFQKAQTVVGSDDLRTEDFLSDWSQEKAENLIVHVALSLNPGDRNFGVFRRNGGRVGLTKATCDHAWIAELFVRALKEQCSDAELSATYVSVNTINTSREIHIDRII